MGRRGVSHWNRTPILVSSWFLDWMAWYGDTLAGYDLRIEIWTTTHCSIWMFAKIKASMSQSSVSQLDLHARCMIRMICFFCLICLNMSGVNTLLPCCLAALLPSCLIYWVSNQLNHECKQTSINGPIELGFSYCQFDCNTTWAMTLFPKIMLKNGATRLYPCGTTEIQPKSWKTYQKVSHINDYIWTESSFVSYQSSSTSLSELSAFSSPRTLGSKRHRAGQSGTRLSSTKQSSGPNPSQTPEHPLQGLTHQSKELYDVHRQRHARD